MLSFKMSSNQNNAKSIKYAKILDHLADAIDFKLLTTRKNAKASHVYQVNDAASTLISEDQFNNLTNKQSILTLKGYVTKVLIPKVKEEIENNMMNDFKGLQQNINNCLNKIKVACSFYLDKTVLKFVKKFHKKAYEKPEIFQKEFENLIALIANQENLKTDFLSTLKSMITQTSQMVGDSLIKLEESIKSFQNLYQISIKEYKNPFSLNYIDQIYVNKGYTIPWTNGIDVHPYKNIYLAISCEGGDLVIVKQRNNQEKKRIPIKNNSSYGGQTCLWSPSGNKFIVSTMENNSIYTYNHDGEEIFQPIVNKYPKNAYSAIWLSDLEVAVGYDDGMIKFFNLQEGKELGSYELKEDYVWGMECLDNSHFLVSTTWGGIYNIDWKNKKIVWHKKEWSTGNKYYNNCCRLIKLNNKKTHLLTGSSDYTIRLMELDSQTQLWKNELNSDINGIAWVPGNEYVIGMSARNLINVFDVKYGGIVFTIDNITKEYYLRSMRLNEKNGELLVGDQSGCIRKFKLTENKN